MIEINLLQSLEAKNGTFGGKVWERQSTLLTVKPESYKLVTRDVCDDDGVVLFTANTIRIPKPDGSYIPVEIKADCKVDNTIDYDIVLFKALRTLEGTKVHKGFEEYKAVPAS